jgi:predicted dehydrogenase
VKLICAAFTFRIGNEGDIRLNNALAGGGLMDVGCYCVSIIRLIGGEPIRGHAVANFGANSGVDEILGGVLQCPNGIIAHFDCGLRAFHESSYEIRGTHGRISLQKAFNPTPNESTTIHWWEEKDGKEQHHAEEIPPTNHYTLMAQEFADALLNDRPLAYPAEDAIKNMRVIDMLLASARSSA